MRAPHRASDGGGVLRVVMAPIWPGDCAPAASEGAHLCGDGAPLAKEGALRNVLSIDSTILNTKSPKNGGGRPRQSGGAPLYNALLL